MTPEEIKAKLQAPFPPEEIEWRVDRITQSSGKFYAHVLAYVQNRAIQSRLDEVFGPFGWKNEFKEWKGQSQICGISVWDSGKETWVTKWDGSDDSNMDAVKGGLSGAMKRAAVQWGIGRYLYNLDSPKLEMTDKGEHWVGKTKINKQEVTVNKCWNTPQLPPWALPEGSQPDTKPAPHKAATGQPDGSSAGTEVKDPPPAQITEKMITEKQMNKISILCGQLLIDETQGKELLKEKYKKSSRQELTSKQASDFIDYLLGKIAKNQNLKLAVGDALGEATYPRGHGET